MQRGVLTIAATVLALIGLAATGFYFYSQPRTLRLAVGPIGRGLRSRWPRRRWVLGVAAATGLWSVVRMLLASPLAWQIRGRNVADGLSTQSAASWWSDRLTSMVVGWVGLTLVVLLLVCSTLTDGWWLDALAVVATAARYLHAVGMLRSASLAQHGPVRDLGAMFTYASGIALGVTALAAL